MNRQKLIEEVEETEAALGFIGRSDLAKVKAYLDKAAAFNPVASKEFTEAWADTYCMVYEALNGVNIRHLYEGR